MAQLWKAVVLAYGTAVVLAYGTAVVLAYGTAVVVAYGTAVVVMMMMSALGAPSGGSRRSFRASNTGGRGAA